MKSTELIYGASDVVGCSRSGTQFPAWKREDQTSNISESKLPTQYPAQRENAAARTSEERKKYALADI